MIWTRIIFNSNGISSILFLCKLLHFIRNILMHFCPNQINLLHFDACLMKTYCSERMNGNLFEITRFCFPIYLWNGRFISYFIYCFFFQFAHLAKGLSLHGLQLVKCKICHICVTNRVLQQLLVYFWDCVMV